MQAREENKILVYAATGMVPDAKATTQKYIHRYGRLARPERRALSKLHIDADMMDVQHHGLIIGPSA